MTDRHTALRAATIPAQIDYPASLPVSEQRDKIMALVREHQVVIVAGETGSGKTTQIPKMCLELGRGVAGMIGHTQPRRIAARTVANRIAEELKVPLGGLVGYQVRFSDNVSAQTAIKLMTDGILLAEIQRDPLLKRYDTLIIDEAHERSLNIDFLLGYLRQLLPQRRDLKIIITSATIDVEKFSRHFNGAPVIEVSGRNYPVEIHYRALEDEEDTDLGVRILAALEELCTTESSSDRGGDVLVFLAGERDIRDVAHTLRDARVLHRWMQQVEILPLYARLSIQEQNRIFAPHTGRRVVLATNVAETALTVPGIRYVIDVGTARISRYSYRTRVQRLPVEAISQASANQRAGRCGRVRDGICVRLYSEQDFQLRSAFTEPEILRTNLASVILQMQMLGLGDIREFPFVEVPDSRLIRDGFRLLEELQAMDREGNLTAFGRQMGRFPVDPRIARMILEASQRGCLNEMLIIASVLSVQDPRERPQDKQQAADEKHRQWWHEKSDFLTLVNLWNGYEAQRQALSASQLQKYCKREFLSVLRMREWREVHHQLRLQCKEAKLRINQELRTDQQSADYVAVHMALLSGQLSHIGCRDDKQDYLGTYQRKFQIFPGSSQGRTRPKWIVAAALLETSRLYAHQVASIEPEWVVSLAPHLVNREYFDPWWERREGRVLAWEKITLYGLTLIEKQKVHYGTLDPAKAHELLLRRALVDGEYTSTGKFIAYNQALIDKVSDLEARIRRRDVLVDDEALYAFYAARVPSDIVTLQRFEQWRKDAEKTAPDLLHMTEQDLLLRSVADSTEAQFPDSLTVADMTFKLHYVFEPKHVDDGVNISVPVQQLHQLQELHLDRLVPGMLREKCTELLKLLPKPIRKQLVPLPNTVERIMPLLPGIAGSLTEALSKAVQKACGVQIASSDWSHDKLDAWYHMNIQVLGDDGTVIGRGRNLPALQAQFREQVRGAIHKVARNHFTAQRYTRWEFGDLAASAQVEHGGISMTAYPVLRDVSDAVELSLVEDSTLAQQITHDGVLRLLRLALPDQVRYLKKELCLDNRTALAFSKLYNREDLIEDMTRCVFIRCFLQGDVPRTAEAFATLLAAQRSELVAMGHAMDKWLSELAVLYHQLQMGLAKLRAPAMQWVINDMQRQLAELVYPGFLAATPVIWLLRYPVYCKAMLTRLEKLAGQSTRDREVTALLARYEMAVPANTQGAEHLSRRLAVQEYRWWLQEWRVSLFDQRLKTSVPVSEKRIATQYAGLQAGVTKPQ